MSDVTPAPAPGKKGGWQEALRSLHTAISNVTAITKHPRQTEDTMSFKVDEALLTRAVPFAWSKSVIETVLTASRSVPSDTLLNAWNLNTDSAWWHFESPLPFQTCGDLPDVGIRALNIGWIYITGEQMEVAVDRQNVLLGQKHLDVQTDEPNHLALSRRLLLHGAGVQRALAIRAWVDDVLDAEGKIKLHILPSHTAIWQENLTVEAAHARNVNLHRDVYGAGGDREGMARMSHDEFGATTVQLMQFLLAGLAWLDQRLLVAADPEMTPLERHRLRTDRNKQASLIKVISLRRTERKHGEQPHDGDGSGREYQCQWTVSGHWRNQVCGVGRQDRRLTWITPYIKGPEGKPLKAPRPTVYTVNR